MEPFKVIWLSEYIFSSYICVCVRFKSVYVSVGIQGKSIFSRI